MDFGRNDGSLGAPITSDRASVSDPRGRKCYLLRIAASGLVSEPFSVASFRRPCRVLHHPVSCRRQMGTHPIKKGGRFKAWGISSDLRCSASANSVGTCHARVQIALRSREGGCKTRGLVFLVPIFPDFNRRAWLAPKAFLAVRTTALKLLASDRQSRTCEGGGTSAAPNAADLMDAALPAAPNLLPRGRG